MGRRRIRIGLDIGVAHIRIVIVDSDTEDLVSVHTLAGEPSPSELRELRPLAAEGAQGPRSDRQPSARERVDYTLHQIRTVLRQLSEEGRLEPADVESVRLGTTWTSIPIADDGTITAGIVIIGSPSSRQRLATPTGDFLPESVKLMSLRLEPDQVSDDAVLRNTLYDLRSRGIQVLVVADETTERASRLEQHVVSASVALGLPALAVHDFAASSSLLTGAEDRARSFLSQALTAAVLLPSLVRLADGVEKTLRACGITAPLFIMTNDGRVVPMDHFRREPAACLYSGNVAGLVGALMLGALETDLEGNAVIVHIGSASTTLAPVRDGKIPIGSPWLEDREVGFPGFALQIIRVAGESLIRLRRGTIVAVGPKTAQELRIFPAWMVAPGELRSARLVTLPADASDAEEYALLETSSGRRIALTVTCAGAVLGLLECEGSGDQGRRTWSPSQTESARLALSHLGQRLALAAEDVAEIVLIRAVDQLAEAVHALLRKHRLDRATPVVGGGTGAGLFLPLLGKNYGLNTRMSPEPEYVGAIGLARTNLRQAEQPPAHLPLVAPDQRMRLVAQALMVDETQLELLAETDGFEVYAGKSRRRHLFGLWPTTVRRVCVCEKNGVIRLRLGDAFVLSMTAAEAPQAIQSFMQWAAGRNRAAVPFPILFLLQGKRILDLCHLHQPQQIMQLIEAELHGLSGDSPVVLLAERPKS